MFLLGSFEHRSSPDGCSFNISWNRQKSTHQGQKFILIFFIYFFHHIVNRGHWLPFFDSLWETVLDKQILVFMKFEDGEYLFKGHVDVGRVLFGATRAEVAFLSASGVSFYGGFCMLDHVEMNSLPLFLLPVVHIYFILYKNLRKCGNRQHFSSRMFYLSISGGRSLQILIFIILFLNWISRITHYDYLLLVLNLNILCYF